MAIAPILFTMLATGAAGASDVLDDEIPVTKLLDTPVLRIQYEDYDFENDHPVVVEFEYQVADGMAWWRMPGMPWTTDSVVVTSVLQEVYALNESHFAFMADQAESIAADPATELAGTWLDLATAYDIAANQ